MHRSSRPRSVSDCVLNSVTVFVQQPALTLVSLLALVVIHKFSSPQVAVVELLVERKANDCFFVCLFLLSFWSLVCFVASEVLTTVCHLAIVNVCVIIMLSIGNTQISILTFVFPVLIC